MNRFAAAVLATLSVVAVACAPASSDAESGQQLHAATAGADEPGVTTADRVAHQLILRHVVEHPTLLSEEEGAALAKSVLLAALEGAGDGPAVEVMAFGCDRAAGTDHCRIQLGVVEEDPANGFSSVYALDVAVTAGTISSARFHLLAG